MATTAHYPEYSSFEDNDSRADQTYNRLAQCNKNNTMTALPVFSVFILRIAFEIAQAWTISVFVDVD